MRKAILIAMIAIVAIALMGCPSITLPTNVGNGTIGSKTGESSGSIILGMFGHANGSVIDAAKAGGITQIGAADITYRTILGWLVITVKTTVTGE